MKEEIHMKHKRREWIRKIWTTAKGTVLVLTVPHGVGIEPGDWVRVTVTAPGCIQVAKLEG